MPENSTPTAPSTARAARGRRLRPELSGARLAAMADSLSVPDGGFTVDLASGADVTTGYAVSVHPECERVIDDPVTADAVAAYVVDMAGTLQRRRRMLGGWRDPDSGLVFLDVSIVVATAAAARRRGQAAGQKAVFDLAAGASMPVRAPRRHGAGTRPASGGLAGSTRPRTARPAHSRAQQSPRRSA